MQTQPSRTQREVYSTGSCWVHWGGRVGYAGGHVGFARLFRYQHVGILNAEGFALRWNISLRILRQYIPDLLTLLLSLRQDKHVQEVRENKLSRSQGDNGTEASS